MLAIDDKHCTDYPYLQCLFRKYSFNLPNVTAQLERLMGTNVVRLTDRNYMQELQRRIQEDYTESVQKRIERRERDEDERQKNLVLKGHYKIQNCPKNVVQVHSIVLAQEMERERAIQLENPSEKCPPELAAHPVFTVNLDTNNIIAKRRAKLKSIREKHVTQLIHQGINWEKRYQRLQEQKRNGLEEARKQREKLIENDQLYKAKVDKCGMDLMQIKDKKFTAEETALEKFIEDEKAEMKKKRKKVKRGAGKGKSNQTKKSALLHTGEPKQVDMVVMYKKDAKDTPLEVTSGTKLSSELVDNVTDEQHANMLENTMQQEVKKQHMLDNIIYERFHYESEWIAELRDTNNVKDMYEIADKIVAITKK